MSSRKVIDCSYCDEQDLSKDTIGLNKKIIHEQVDRFLCLKCMADFLECSSEDLLEKIKDFKDEGCELFS